MPSQRRPQRPSPSEPAPRTDAAADAKVPSNAADQAIRATGSATYKPPVMRWPRYYKSKAYVYRRRSLDRRT